MNETFIVGKISRLVSGMAGNMPVVSFYIGGVKCSAGGGLAVTIVGVRGFPGHTIEAYGKLNGNVLDITKVDLVD